MTLTLFFTILGAVSATSQVCRFLFWIDNPRRR